MRFGNQLWLWTLLLIPFLIIFFIRIRILKKRALEKFAQNEMLSKIADNYSSTKWKWKIILLIIGFIFLIIAISNPQIGTKMITIKKSGIDIIIAFDTSSSMLAEDIPPNRIMSAKYALKKFISKVNSDRIGLVAFAGEAFSQCPLTLDYGAVKMFVDILDTTIIPKQGTAIGSAIRTAVNSFLPGEKKHKVILLLTDGEDHETKPIDAAKFAKENGVVIYTIGIGTESGAPIPIKNSKGEIDGYKKDNNNETVMTKLNEKDLLKISSITGGKYFRATNSEMALDKILKEISKMDKKELSTNHYAQYEDRFYYFLFISFICFLAELIINERKRLKK